MALLMPMQYVLVVEDDRSIREALVALLGDAGFVAVGVSDGAEALIALDLPPLPGLLLADLDMPGVDGEQLLRKMRAHPRWREVPVIIYSALAGRARGLGVPFLEKPASAGAILDHVRRLLGENA